MSFVAGVLFSLVLAKAGESGAAIPLLGQHARGGLLLQAPSRGASGRRQQARPTRPARRPAVPAQSAPSTDDADDTDDTPPARATAGTPRGRVQMHCQGNVNYYGMLGNYVSTDAFEFRTVLDWGAQNHRVALVVKGPLFSTGTSYSILGFSDDVARLGASSTKDHVLIDTVLLDTRTGKLAGRGEIRGRFTSSRGNLGNRRVEVDGQCESL